ncbi:AbrB/MazE/SpoVT family DNA-binding domain-containing protein [Exiguobacterium sp. s26]|uniref:AbrB/MazE/SpoVT family DNA-binding domain-containing protein n=1 Tax=Exiguobacterium sp. s26 TaxID=2751231 RepID=UPI001BE82939|nr:AbrB/MazE/SpoVT family DNA-binding domain-containing protein [Exiguobacterium sp. s26]
MGKQNQYERKLIKHGDSVCISIPMTVLRQLKLGAGDEVSIVPTDKGILIRPLEDTVQTDIDSKFSEDMEKTIEQHNDTFKGLVER